MEKATFGAGCFWGVEAAFREVNGVTSVVSGYTGGHTPNPTYQQVCAHTTGHAEAVEIEFDPRQVSFEKLLEKFWSIHDPTTLNRQGPDIGTQYRSAIFFHSSEQETAANSSRDRLQNSSKLGKRKIVTEIVAAKEFWRAEEYHQRYFEKNGISHCHF